MKAAILSKPAKGLVLASGLLLGSSVFASAQTATLNVAAQASVSLASFYQNPPAGPALPNTTVPYDLSGQMFVYLASGDKPATFTASYKNPSAVYLLLNTSYTFANYAGNKAGQVTLTYSDGSTESTDLTIGVNIREWRVGAGSAVVGTTSDALHSSNAWKGAAEWWMGGGDAVIDQLKVVPGSSGKTLTGVTVSRASNDTMAVRILLSGITVDYTPIDWPGNSGNTDSVLHRQNVGHSNAAKFGGTAGANAQDGQTSGDHDKQLGHGKLD